MKKLFESQNTHETTERSLQIDKKTEEILFKLVYQKNLSVNGVAQKIWDLLQKRKHEWEDQGRKPTELELTDELKKQSANKIGMLFCMKSKKKESSWVKRHPVFKNL
ncbi:hypothetical protein IT408_01475 [Candidatus Uhrbacteria bacterium]|nr:hypothetical protein [Candidatus Uhrbacteria bacterium]